MKDEKVCVNLEVLASTMYNQPSFSPLTDFLLTKMVYHGDMVTLFCGKYKREPAVVEVCNRIPYRIVCREIRYLTELAGIPGIPRILGQTKNSSLGIASIAYEWFDFMPYSVSLSLEQILPIFKMLLSTLNKIHHKSLSHRWISRQTVHILKDLSGFFLTSFHCAAKIGDPIPMTIMHPCMSPDPCFSDPRKDDIYSAAEWFLSFFDDKSQIPASIAEIISKMKKAEIELEKVLEQL